MAAKFLPRTNYLLALSCSTLVSLGLFLYGAYKVHSLDYSYLVWNLFLAWLPLFFALWLVRTLRHKLWSSWEALLVSVVWLLFLPNSFYMISDFIHLEEVARGDVVYAAVMFTSFIYTGVVLGFSSLYLIHVQLKKRFGGELALSIIGSTLLLCSAAIYVGRDLRWNSWDIFTNPGGLIFDISDRLLHPASYPQMFLIIGSFFVLLFSMYNLVWRSTQLLQRATGHSSLL